MCFNSFIMATVIVLTTYGNELNIFILLLDNGQLLLRMLPVISHTIHRIPTFKSSFSQLRFNKTYFLYFKKYL